MVKKAFIERDHMPKILITTSSFDLRHIPQAELLAQAGFEIILNPHRRRLTEDEVKSLLADDVVAMIAGVEPLTGSVLHSAKHLKVLARCGIGLDNVDLAVAQCRGIRVSNTPDAPTLPVAELTLAHMLNLLRSISLADRKIRDAKWSPVMGSLLAGKIVGIIGFGRIGRKVAELVTAFGAPVLANDLVHIPPLQNVKGADLNRLLGESDIVSLHVPYTPQTRHLIGGEQIGRMKPSAYLVNISRGGLVDETALYDALVENRLAGAGLDTFEQEPYAGPLCSLDNVLLTAHMGSYAKEARAKQEQEAAENLMAAMRELKLLE